jgi:E3 ubiquitin-protein ligase EDD1
MQTILNERCDGNRNILHACINMCAPTSNKENDQGSFHKILYKMLNSFFFCLRYLHVKCLKGIEHELVTNTVDTNSAPIEEPIPTLSWPPEVFDNTSGEEDSLLGIGATSISMINKSGMFVNMALIFLFTLSILSIIDNIIFINLVCLKFKLCFYLI